MQGKILDYNNEFKSGLIRGDDGNKYRFSVDDVKSATTPKVGAEVDFESSGDKAVEVYVLDQKTAQASATKSEPTPTINPETQTNVVQVVKKIVIWIVAIIIGIAAIVALFVYVENQKREAKHQEEEARITKLKNECANNNSTACYELAINHLDGLDNAEKKQEALAKGCQLGNKDACREGKYYEKGCELKDGESCYEVGKELPSNLNIGIGKSYSCAVSPKNDGCEEINRIRAVHTKKYNKLACEYGYSQGCMKK